MHKPIGITAALVVVGGHALEDSMKNLTPVILVEAIEPCLGFWEDLGFKRNGEVPEGDKLGFVSLSSGGVEVTYQSRARVANDIAALFAGHAGRRLSSRSLTKGDELCPLVVRTAVRVPRLGTESSPRC